MFKPNGESDSVPLHSLHMEKLESLLQDRNSLFTCIRDLLENGPTGTFHANEGLKPSRHEITHYLAKWARSVGLSHSQCLEWLVGYSVDVLARISSSSLSQIRHNTKSIVKFVYGSEVTFHCGKQKNAVKGRCEGSCPIHDTVPESPDNESEAHTAAAYFKREIHADPPEPVFVSVKEAFFEQFEQAMVIARAHRENGMSISRIVKILNDKGFKTRTGKPWTAGICSNELRRSGEEG